MEDLTDFETVVFSSFSGLTILVAKIALFYEIIGGGCWTAPITQRVFSTQIGLMKPMVNSDEINKMFWFQVTVPIKRDPWKIEIIEMIISVFCFHHNKQQPHNILSTTPQQQPKDSPKPTILDCKLRHPILKFIQIISRSNKCKYYG